MPCSGLHAVLATYDRACTVTTISGKCYAAYHGQASPAGAYKAICHPECGVDQVGNTCWKVDRSTVPAAHDLICAAEGRSIVGNCDDVAEDTPACSMQQPAS